MQYIDKDNMRDGKEKWRPLTFSKVWSVNNLTCPLLLYNNNRSHRRKYGDIFNAEYDCRDTISAIVFFNRTSPLLSKDSPKDSDCNV